MRFDRIPLVTRRLWAGGPACEEILTEYPDLEREDIEQALTHSAWLADEAVHPA